MPLPLPNLDTRRWDDLVEEGRALIPRYAPGWTDHNAHDPGMTLIELLAWQVEQEMYRANRIPDHNRRKFLALVGFPVDSPRPAKVTLAFAVGGGAPLALPEGLTFATTMVGRDGEPPVLVPFRLLHALMVLPVAVSAVQSFDGARFADRTRQSAGSRPFPAWGEAPGAAGEPDLSPALYIGLDSAPPAGSEFRVWFEFASGRSDECERGRIVREAEEQAIRCRPIGPATVVDCDDEDTSAPTTSADGPPRHHGMETAWEYWDGSVWQSLTVADVTRALTLDGSVVAVAPAGMQPLELGEVPGGQHYIRCRLASGWPDAPPMVSVLALNAARAEQSVEARASLAIAPGVVPPAGREPVVGVRQRLELAFDNAHKITVLAVGASDNWPEVLVIKYLPATPITPGELVCTLWDIGCSTGLPGMGFVLPGPIASGSCMIWGFDGGDAERWHPRSDLDAAGPLDAEFALDPATGLVSFGDGRRGRIPVRGVALFASYSTTFAAGGNVAAGSPWTLAGADDAVNTALLGADVELTAAQLAAMANPGGARGGALEDTAHATGRAAEALWAHERLVELVADGEVTLDQRDRATVLSRVAPPRATTLLDYERIALDVPGTIVGRARAWVGMDPAYPCLKAPGTVALIVVPYLPVGRPEPTVGLFNAIRRYLDRRRIIGSRLVVVGPEYVTVRVHASVKSLPRAANDRVQADIVTALNTLLDPMAGGPDGRGWPFGRDVYRSEILQVIDGVAGVDHILNLELFGGEDDAQCGNICVGPIACTTPGQHQVVVS